MKNFYEILGVEKGTSQDDIKKAYRSLAIKYHPDKNPGDTAAEEKFKQISEAYDILGDESKRGKYDRSGQHVQYSDNFNFMRDNMFSHSWSQVFDEMYGNKGTKKGVDIMIQLAFTMQEAYTGVSKDVQLNGKSYKINIKKGVETGQKLRIKGLGHRHNSGINGDLIIIPTVLMDERFIRRDADLFVDLNVHVYTIMAGGPIEVPTPEGSLMHTISPMTEGTIAIPGCGMPFYDSDKKGNLMVKIHPFFPRQVSIDEKNLIEQLKTYEK